MAGFWLSERRRKVSGFSLISSLQSDRPPEGTDMRRCSALGNVIAAGFALALTVSGFGTATAQTKDLTVEKLLQDGWEVVGFVRAWENRTLILFKHKQHAYLVQCSVLIDVTRTPRVVPVCYEIR